MLRARDRVVFLTLARGGQVGVATGVAALGTTLAARVHSLVLDDLRGTVLSGQMHTIAHQVSIGAAAQAVTSVPPASRRGVAVAARSALVQGLNTILLIAAVVAFIAAAWCALIRERDFVTAPSVAAGH
ncbi:MAG TPA: hypothetical protein VHW04_14020 [Solirubrobacteraceae bacterium]|nr:hypothetical protein [Solirubrobacteraceae bacterium]